MGSTLRLRRGRRWSKALSTVACSAKRACAFDHDVDFLAPDAACRSPDEIEFGTLLVVAHRRVGERCEPALCGDREIIEWSNARSLGDPCFDLLFGLERGVFCREQSEHDGGARGDGADRAEVAGSSGVVLEQDDVDVEVAK